MKITDPAVLSQLNPDQPATLSQPAAIQQPGSMVGMPPTPEIGGQKIDRNFIERAQMAERQRDPIMDKVQEVWKHSPHLAQDLTVARKKMAGAQKRLQDPSPVDQMLWRLLPGSRKNLENLATNPNLGLSLAKGERIADEPTAIDFIPGARKAVSMRSLVKSGRIIPAIPFAEESTTSAMTTGKKALETLKGLPLHSYLHRGAVWAMGDIAVRALLKKLESLGE